MITTCKNSGALRSIHRLWAGSRVSVFVEAVASGRAEKNLLADFPYLDAEDIREALTYAARLAQGREVQLVS
jgi:uncharacterized protein (DUF433 family)